jgi:membrane-associated protease RseP (regulator of RpoE activity)
MISAYTLSVILFIVAVIVIIYRDRKKIERHFVLVLRKTNRGKQLLIKISSFHPQFWKYLGNVGVFVGFSASIYIFYLFITIAIKSLMVKPTTPSLALLLPSPTSQTVILPGIIAPPFWDWVISIALLVVVHEGLHGIMAAVEKVKIKSLGWGFLAIIPLAFVEPDEKQLAKKPIISQLRVFAAGSFSNFMLAGICALISILFISGFYIQSGAALITEVENQSGDAINATVIIERIDNYTIKNATDLNKTLEAIGPNKTVRVLTRIIKNGNITYKDFILTTVDSNKIDLEGGFIGIRLKRIATVQEIKDEYTPYRSIISFFDELIGFIFLINLGVGLANLLPIKPLDGGRMWELLFKKVAPKYSKKAINILSYATILLLLFNFLAPWV